VPSRLTNPSLVICFCHKVHAFKLPRLGLLFWQVLRLL
jgi:hypothetical protein